MVMIVIMLTIREMKMQREVDVVQIKLWRKREIEGKKK